MRSCRNQKRQKRLERWQGSWGRPHTSRTTESRHRLHSRVGEADSKRGLEDRTRDRNTKERPYIAAAKERKLKGLQELALCRQESAGAEWNRGATCPAFCFSLSLIMGRTVRNEENGISLKLNTKLDDLYYADDKISEWMPEINVLRGMENQWRTSKSF